MKRLINFLSWGMIGGTLGMNHIFFDSLSFWLIFIAVAVAEYTESVQ